MTSMKTEIIYLNPSIIYGFHIMKQKSFYKTFHDKIDTPLRAFQIYVSNSRSYLSPKLDDIDDIIKARELLIYANKYLCIHASLIYNLCGHVMHRDSPLFDTNLNNTIKGLTAELDMGVALNAGVVVHIGSCKDKKKGIFTICRVIESVLSKKTNDISKIAKRLNLKVDEAMKKRKIILENAAGEGHKIGSTLQEIEAIFEGVSEVYRSQMRVCIDTAHIFGAGQYDFGKSKDVHKFFKKFDKLVGIDKLEVFHLNDSRVPFGSKKDRHENLSLGYIFSDSREDGINGLEGLSTLIDYSKKYLIALIGEPPNKTSDKKEGPGGYFDYEILKKICPIDERYII
jgi:apurinic endonuclease APN1